MKKFNPEKLYIDESRSRESVKILFNEIKMRKLEKAYFPFENIEKVEEKFLKGKWFYLFYYDNIPSAAVWIMDFEGTSAKIHFFIFNTNNRYYAVPAAKYFLKKLFKSCRHELMCLLGFIEERNRAARFLVSRIGFRPYGVLKNYYGKEWNAALYVINSDNSEEI